MKRILFFVIVWLQILFLSLISFQYSLIDQFGEEIKLKTVRNYGQEFGWIDHKENLHPNFDIERINKDKWTVDSGELTYQDKVYVVLTQDDDGFYVVKEASTKKLTAVEGEVVLIGSYNYADNGVYEVDFQLGNIRKELHQSINHRNTFTVTVKLAPWGQRKVIKLEKTGN